MACTPVGFKRLFMHECRPAHPRNACRAPLATREPHLQLLGGFASRISTKRHNTPAFPQVGGANSEQLPSKTAQKSRTMAKSAPISCETAQNSRGHDRGQGRGNPQRRRGRNPKHRRCAAAGKAAATVNANAGATDASAAPDIAANAPPSPVQKRFGRRQRPRPLCRPLPRGTHLVSLLAAETSLHKRKGGSQHTCRHAHRLNMRTYPNEHLHQTRRKPSRECAHGKRQRSPVPAPTKSSSHPPPLTRQKVTHTYQKLPCRAVIPRSSIVNVASKYRAVALSHASRNRREP